jgi:hypothetical protein
MVTPLNLKQLWDCRKVFCKYNIQYGIPSLFAGVAYLRTPAKSKPVMHEVKNFMEKNGVRGIKDMILNMYT